MARLSPPGRRRCEGQCGKQYPFPIRMLECTTAVGELALTRFLSPATTSMNGTGFLVNAAVRILASSQVVTVNGITVHKLTERKPTVSHNRGGLAAAAK